MATQAQRLAEERRQRQPREELIEVEATQLGYYDLRRRHVGEIFEVPERLLAASWMIRTDGVEIPEREVAPPERTVTVAVPQAAPGVRMRVEANANETRPSASRAGDRDPLGPRTGNDTDRSALRGRRDPNGQVDERDPRLKAGPSTEQSQDFEARGRSDMLTEGGQRISDVDRGERKGLDREDQTIQDTDGESNVGRNVNKEAAEKADNAERAMGAGVNREDPLNRTGGDQQRTRVPKK